jgi:hypothetical protein
MNPPTRRRSLFRNLRRRDRGTRTDAAPVSSQRAAFDGRADPQTATVWLSVFCGES